MWPRFAINLILLTFIVSATTLFLIQKESEQKNNMPETISSIKAEEIDDITINHQDKETIRFKKEGPRWKMLFPFQATADQQRIETILGLLKSRSTDRLTARDIDLTQFDLGPDQPNVTLAMNNEVFAFGKVNLLNKKRYVLYNNTIYLIHDNLYPQLMARSTFFIDKKVIPHELDIQAVQYPQYRLFRKEGLWQLKSALTITEEKIQLLGKIWQELHASFIQKHLPSEPLYEIRIEFDNKPPINYMVVSDLPDLILARPEIGIQYHIPEDLAEKLFP